ncbi:ectonucleotide pyrophosphatase/phosphodiesterase [Phenylobacterium sp.]|uniref:alkaline phosphatase family protein n=1 Tax=Phenylobacterium sp. TaxID=1871053 RepID=UPI003D26B0A8
MRRCLILLFALLLTACATSAPRPASRPLVILISIDGYRADYLDRGGSPVLAQLAKTGARGMMRPSFPSKTFPNHYTLVTGLRPDRHGIVENNIEDPEIPGVTFRMSNVPAVQDARWWDQGEPIWVTAERAGIVAGAQFWPGSEAAVRGVRPSYWRRFDQSVPPEARVDQVLGWLDLPRAQRPGLVALYFDDVDTAGHDYGPDSAELNAAVARVDGALGRLTAGLKARGIVANVIVVADHGMAPMSTAREVFLDDVAPREAFRVLAGGAFVTLYPEKGREAELDRALIRPHEHFQCWRKAEIPARFHYGKNPRVAPYVCLPETGWRLSTRDYKPSKPERGAHGFDPDSPAMAAIFVANGPGIRTGVMLAPFDNVSVYPMLAKLLGVAPEENDGDLRQVADALTR